MILLMPKIVLFAVNAAGFHYDYSILKMIIMIRMRRMMMMVMMMMMRRRRRTLIRADLSWR